MIAAWQYSWRRQFSCWCVCSAMFRLFEAVLWWPMLWFWWWWKIYPVQLWIQLHLRPLFERPNEKKTMSVMFVVIQLNQTFFNGGGFRGGYVVIHNSRVWFSFDRWFCWNGSFWFDFDSSFISLFQIPLLIFHFFCLIVCLVLFFFFVCCYFLVAFRNNQRNNICQTR